MARKTARYSPDIMRMVEQQLVGGAWMGMSHALWETTEPYYPERTHGPVDFNQYLMPGPGDVAAHNVAILERPAPDGPYGGKGVGEMCSTPPIPAIANAIFDAVGVRIDEMPFTPEKILRALKARGGARWWTSHSDSAYTKLRLNPQRSCPKRKNRKFTATPPPRPSSRARPCGASPRAGWDRR